jgi:hypothetical protein
LAGCEKDYEKEERYTVAMNKKFNSTIPEDIKEQLRETSFILSDTLNFKLKGNLCAIKYENPLINNIKFALDHSFNQELISNGYHVSYKLKDVSYLIFTNDVWTKIGTYVDSNGKRKNDANIIDNYLYVYDLSQKKVYFVLFHKGQRPSEEINHDYQSIGENWHSDNFVNYLIENKFLDKKSPKDIEQFKELKLSYPENYTKYLDENNFLNLDVTIDD